MVAATDGSADLHRDNDRILRAEVGGIVAGGQLHGDRAVGRLHRQAVGTDRREMRAACHHGDVDAALGQVACQIAADGPGAKTQMHTPPLQPHDTCQVETPKPQQRRYRRRMPTSCEQT